MELVNKMIRALQSGQPVQLQPSQYADLANKYKTLDLIRSLEILIPKTDNAISAEYRYNNYEGLTREEEVSAVDYFKHVAAKYTLNAGLLKGCKVTKISDSFMGAMGKIDYHDALRVFKKEYDSKALGHTRPVYQNYRTEYVSEWIRPAIIQIQDYTAVWIPQPQPTSQEPMDCSKYLFRELESRLRKLNPEGVRLLGVNPDKEARILSYDGDPLRSTVTVQSVGGRPLRLHSDAFWTSGTQYVVTFMLFKNDKLIVFKEFSELNSKCKDIVKNYLYYPSQEKIALAYLTLDDYKATNRVLREIPGNLYATRVLYLDDYVEDWHKTFRSERLLDVYDPETPLMYGSKGCGGLRFGTFQEHLEMAKRLINVETRYTRGKSRQSKHRENPENDGIERVHLDCTWYTSIIRSEGFGVKGHFRLQPCKDKDKKWVTKLIYIKPYKKNGLTRRAKVLNQ